MRLALLKRSLVSYSTIICALRSLRLQMSARLSVTSPNCIPDGILGRSFSLTPIAIGVVPPPQPASSSGPPNGPTPVISGGTPLTANDEKNLASGSAWPPTSSSSRYADVGGGYGQHREAEAQ